MALTRNSKMVEARRKARELAQAMQERESQLVTLAEEYFIAGAEAEDVIDRAEEKAQQVIAAAQEKAESIRQNAREESERKSAGSAETIRKMLALGVSRPDVAARLGVSAAVVRKSSAATPPAAAKDRTEEGIDTASTTDVSGVRADSAA